ncbi:MAG: alpha/beta fold hydrolase [Myxococcota bacterium]
MDQPSAEPFTIDVGAPGNVSGLLYRAHGERAGISLLLAHGAGADQHNEFMVHYAQELARRGVDTATFNFLYTEQGRRTPDRTAQLEACFVAAMTTMLSLPGLSGQPLFIGGKSMGGRMATHLAARAEPPSMMGVVALGYPLHPPKEPQNLRVAHLPSIRVPVLFVQGTRDEFGSPDELRPYLADVKHATLHVVEGADHGFKVLKRQGVPQAAVHGAIQDEVLRFMKGVLARG